MNFHHVHNSEGFFKNILLQTIPFHDKKHCCLKITLNFHMYENVN